MEIRVSMTDIRPHLSELLGRVEFGGEKVVIEKFGVPTAALVTMDDLSKIYKLEADEIAQRLSPRTGARGALVTVAKVLVLRRE